MLTSLHGWVRFHKAPFLDEDNQSGLKERESGSQIVTPSQLQKRDWSSCIQELTESPHSAAISMEVITIENPIESHRTVLRRVAL